MAKEEYKPNPARQGAAYIYGTELKKSFIPTGTRYNPLKSIPRTDADPLGIPTKDLEGTRGMKIPGISDKARKGAFLDLHWQDDLTVREGTTGKRVKLGRANIGQNTTRLYGFHRGHEGFWMYDNYGETYVRDWRQEWFLKEKKKLGMPHKSGHTHALYKDKTVTLAEGKGVMVTGKEPAGVYKSKGAAIGEDVYRSWRHSYYFGKTRRGRDFINVRAIESQHKPGQKWNIKGGKGSHFKPQHIAVDISISPSRAAGISDEVLGTAKSNAVVSYLSKNWAGKTELKTLVSDTSRVGKYLQSKGTVATLSKVGRVAAAGTGIGMAVWTVADAGVWAIKKQKENPQWQREYAQKHAGTYKSKGYKAVKNQPYLYGDRKGTFRKGSMVGPYG